MNSLICVNRSPSNLHIHSGSSEVNKYISKLTQILRRFESSLFLYTVVVTRDFIDHPSYVVLVCLRNYTVMSN